MAFDGAGDPERAVDAACTSGDVDGAVGRGAVGHGQQAAVSTAGGHRALERLCLAAGAGPVHRVNVGADRGVRRQREEGEHRERWSGIHHGKRGRGGWEAGREIWTGGGTEGSSTRTVRTGGEGLTVVELVAT